MKINENLFFLLGLICKCTHGGNLPWNNLTKTQDAIRFSYSSTKRPSSTSIVSWDDRYKMSVYWNRSLSWDLFTTSISLSNDIATSIKSPPHDQESSNTRNDTFLSAGKGPGIYHTVPGSTNKSSFFPDSKYCVAEDQTCFAQGIVSELRDVCSLWDSTCSGNRTEAIQEFFNQTIGSLTFNRCFNHIGGYDCGDEINSMLDPVRRWMRSSSCMAAQELFAEPTLGRNASESCCGSCHWENSAVELFYWPGPPSEVDTSCLSIIGTSVHPVDYGATTAGATTYFGCTGYDSASSLVTVTTAMLRTQGPITVKRYMTNPWDETQCNIVTGPDITTTVANIPTTTTNSFILGLGLKSSQIHAGCPECRVDVPAVAKRDEPAITTTESDGFTLYVFPPSFPYSDSDFKNLF